MWFKQPPTRTFVKNSGSKSKSGSKILKCRATLLVGGNASGCYKTKPLIVWTSKTPRAFKRLKGQALPLHYRNNTKGWMLKSLFAEWFYKMFCPDMKMYCSDRNLDFKILLLVDNCTGHPYLEHENVKIHFLPSRTTSLIQPMDQGAISIMKTNYKYRLLKAAVEASKANNKTLIEFLKSFDILHAIYMIADAWDDVPQTAMRGVWNRLLKRNKGFEPDLNQKIDNIVDLGQSLGIQDIDAAAVREYIDVESETLSNEDLVDWDNELSATEKKPLETEEELEILPSNNLNKEKLIRLTKCINEATEIASEFDGNYERSLVLQNTLNTASKPYLELLRQKIEKTLKQPEISNFVEMEVPEISAEKNKNSEKVQVRNPFANLKKSGKLVKGVKGNGIGKKTPIVIDLDDTTEKMGSLNESNTKLCECCDDNFVVAYYCEECKDHICVSCYQAHKQVRLTRNHTIVVVEVISANVNESNLKICNACEDDSLASYYCEQCSDNLCEKCFDAHKKVKLTRNHNLTALAM